MKFKVGYKCRICGEIQYVGELDCSETEIKEILCKLLEDQVRGKVSVHNCIDGSIGIFDLVGGKRV